ncbi:MAG: methylmalonyl-CoA epimerase [Chloroflexi bacterium]|nr:methylmalonyl-CoA epimerase [Chloroflexota bacterium]
MARIKKINHVAIVVPEIEGALGFWEQALGLEVHHIEEVPSQKSRVAFLPAGESKVELVTPSSSDSTLAKFLQERGPGIHHVCLEVDNLEEMLADLKEKGVRLINEIPQVLPGRKMAFIHPKSAGGVLVELYEVTAEGH